MAVSPWAGLTRERRFDGGGANVLAQQLEELRVETAADAAMLFPEPEPARLEPLDASE
jgi:hypothetical protein